MIARAARQSEIIIPPAQIAAVAPGKPPGAPSQGQNLHHPSRRGEAGTIISILPTALKPRPSILAAFPYYFCHYEPRLPALFCTSHSQCGAAILPVSFLDLCPLFFSPCALIFLSHPETQFLSGIIFSITCVHPGLPAVQCIISAGKMDQTSIPGLPRRID